MQCFLIFSFHQIQQHSFIDKAPPVASYYDAHDHLLPSLPHLILMQLLPPVPPLLLHRKMVATLPMRACLLAGLPLLLQGFLMPAPQRQTAFSSSSSRSSPTTITQGTRIRSKWKGRNEGCLHVVDVIKYLSILCLFSPP